MPIHWAVENLFTLQILQSIGVVGGNLRDSERPNPQGFKFSMFSLILFRSIPLQHNISCLEPLLLGLLIEDLLDLLLMFLNPVHCLLSSLLDLY
jgi:hypothetical protein